jgi:hypothetical protein
MSENRLNALAMANINKKEQFDESKIIIEFARNSPKRMAETRLSIKHLFCDTIEHKLSAYQKKLKYKRKPTRLSIKNSATLIHFQFLTGYKNIYLNNYNNSKYNMAKK